MREGCSHAKVGDKQLHYPSARVKGKTLLGKQCRVNFKVVVEDEQLVVNSSVFVEELLRQL